MKEPKEIIETPNTWGIYQTVNGFFQNQLITPIQDAYNLYTRRSEYIMSEGCQRSKETGVGIMEPLPFGGVIRNIPFINELGQVASYIPLVSRLKKFIPPRIYVFSGTENNLNTIAEYGEKNGDPKARQPHDRVYEATGAITIVNQLGQAAMAEKRKIVKNLSKYEAFDYARELGMGMSKIWKQSSSLQDNITYIGALVIGKCFLGIESFPRKYVPLLRKINDLIADGDASTSEFKDMRKKMLALSAKILREQGLNMLNKEEDGSISQKKGYGNSQYDLDGDESLPEALEKLINSHAGAAFIVESNLSFIIMAAIAHVSSSSEILQKLYEEISSTTVNTFQDLNKLTYLDSIYRETLRFTSPTAVVPRFASQQSSIPVKSSDGKESSCNISPNSHLFFTIRAIHHDKVFWENPFKFDPGRFRKDSETNANHFMGEHYFPFSGGRRGCPAGSGFVEYAFKGFLLEFFKKFKLTFERPLENIPASEIHPRWKNEYSAILQEHNLYTPIMQPYLW